MPITEALMGCVPSPPAHNEPVNSADDQDTQATEATQAIEDSQTLPAKAKRALGQAAMSFSSVYCSGELANPDLPADDDDIEEPHSHNATVVSASRLLQPDMLGSPIQDYTPSARGPEKRENSASGVRFFHLHGVYQRFKSKTKFLQPRPSCEDVLMEGAGQEVGAVASHSDSAKQTTLQEEPKATPKHRQKATKDVVRCDCNDDTQSMAPYSVNCKNSALRNFYRYETSLDTMRHVREMGASYMLWVGCLSLADDNLA